MKAHIQIVGWNHREHLEACVKSCLNQTMKIPVLYIDNASDDGSAEHVETTFPTIRVHRNADNRGYSGGHNDGLCLIPDSEIAILLNPDVVLDERFVEEILKPFQDERVGAVVPLLLQGNREQRTGDNTNDAVDAYGTKLTSSLRAVHNGENQRISVTDPSSLYPVPLREPWGFTGAAVALRKTTLDDVKIDGHVFDEDLFAYREDVDLSWRLHHRGWKIVGVPSAQATHERQVKRGAEKSPQARQLSWRNYFLVLIKSVPSSTLRSHLFFVLGESLVRVAQVFVTPSLWPAVPSFFRLVPILFRKRRESLRKTVV